MDWTVDNLDNTPQSGTVSGAYRAPQWNGIPSDEAQLVMVKSNIMQKAYKDSPDAAYFFDAFIREEHSHSCAITEHPVQNGANISDHAYNLPTRLTFDILMSDAMDSIVSGQFGDGPTKSISAYNVLKKLKEARMPLQITTRLQVYDNMLIEQLHVIDDRSTLYGLRANVTLKQIFTAKVQSVKVSVRPNTTDEIKKGSVQPQQPTQDQQKQFDEIYANRLRNSKQLMEVQ